MSDPTSKEVKVKKVYIVGGDSIVKTMFTHYGWSFAPSIEEADLVQFTGGADVGPELYGEERQPGTFTNPRRDAEEHEVYTKALSLGKPMAGICRGGQFLNVMNGGKMWQHISDDSHCTGDHNLFLLQRAYDFLGKPNQGIAIKATSTHHQMMLPAPGPALVGYALECEAEDHPTNGVLDYEILFYNDTRSLCFQPHPEYMRGANSTDLSDLYFQFIDKLMSGERFPE